MRGEENERQGWKGPFRRVALERYHRPFENDTPELLARRRPGLIVGAILLVLLSVWLWPFPGH